MKIRQLVKKVNESLGENPKDWNFGQHFKAKSLSNSRGLDLINGHTFLVRDKWQKSTQMFLLNDKEVEFLSPNFNKLAKNPSKKTITRINKRRAWLVKEVIKTL